MEAPGDSKNMGCEGRRGGFKADITMQYGYGYGYVT